MEEILTKLIEEQKVIPFIGAGVSKSVIDKKTQESLFIGWESLIFLMLDELSKYEADEADFIKMALKLKKYDYLKAAEEIKHHFPTDTLFYECLTENFDKESSEAVDESLALARSIWGLNQKLIITTNYDKVLHWASPSPKDTNKWDIESISAQSKSLSNSINKETVWHLHGHIENTNNMILTDTSYKELYSNEGKFKVAYNVLKHHLASKSLLFIGYSLEDEFFMNELENICKLFEGQSSTHYILLENNKPFPERFKKLINPIFFEKKGQHLINKIKSFNVGASRSKSENLFRNNQIKENNDDLIENQLVVDDFKLKCNNNLPLEDYNIDGGFVGRETEIQKIKELIYTNEDRIITVTGAGGLGKTATVLKCAYTFLYDEMNPFSNIVWFSAKEDKLTSDDGIVQIESQISDYLLLLQDILKILNTKTYQTFFENDFKEEVYRESIYKIFMNNRSLLIIDNLETIQNEDIKSFIKDIPRPSQVLITSRMGLGEIERRRPLLDFSVEDAIKLFRIVSKERDREDLSNLSDEVISVYVKNVSSYPLLIKWSIGKICLGMDIEKAFKQIYSGDSEISQFVFNDIFKLISNNSRKCLYSMVIFGDKPISKYLMQHISSLTEDEIEESIRELIVSSFIYSEVKEEDLSTTTIFSMLLLTRGFIKYKLESKIKIKNELLTKYRGLNLQIEKSQKSKDSFEKSLLEFGIKTEEDKVAFNYIKTAKNYVKVNDEVEARKNFNFATSIAPSLSYAWSEYGKFESSLGDNHEAEKHHLRACLEDDNNFRTHFTYGVFLRKTNDIDTAITHLEKARKLNPKYLPVYNELGRALSFNGQYSDANENFKISLNQEEELTNYKHLNITLYYKSDNYERWAQSLFLRKDYENGKKKLFRSLKIIKDVNSTYKYDVKNQELEKKICQTVGQTMIQLGDYPVGKAYLLKSIKDIRFSKHSNENSFHSYYILLNYIYNNKIDEPEVSEFLKQASSLITNQRTKSKFDKIEDKLLNKNIKKGIIKFFNVSRSFGVIDTINDSYTFVIGDLMSKLDTDELYNLEGVKVTFKEKPNSESKKFAKSVYIQES